MHSFEVHSNESACRKSGRLGLEQVMMAIGTTKGNNSYGGSQLSREKWTVHGDQKQQENPGSHR